MTLCDYEIQILLLSILLPIIIKVYSPRREGFVWYLSETEVLSIHNEENKESCELPVSLSYSRVIYRWL